MGDAEGGMNHADQLVPDSFEDLKKTLKSPIKVSVITSCEKYIS